MLKTLTLERLTHAKCDIQRLLPRVHVIWVRYTRTNLTVLYIA